MCSVMGSWVENRDCIVREYSELQDARPVSSTSRGLYYGSLQEIGQAEVDRCTLAKWVTTAVRRVIAIREFQGTAHNPVVEHAVRDFESRT